MNAYMSKMELENQDLRGGEAAAPLCQNETPQEWAYHCVFQSQDLQSIYPEGILSPVYEECPTEHVALATNGQQVQTTAFMIYPRGYFPVEDDGNLPTNCMAASIFVTLFCCLPIGMCAMYNAIKVDDALSRGDVVAARKASHTAKQLTGLAVVFGVFFCLGLYWFYSRYFI